MKKSKAPIGVCSCGTVFYSAGHRKYHACPATVKGRPADAHKPNKEQ